MTSNDKYHFRLWENMFRQILLTHVWSEKASSHSSDQSVDVQILLPRKYHLGMLHTTDVDGFSLQFVGQQCWQQHFQREGVCCRQLRAAASPAAVAAASTLPIPFQMGEQDCLCSFLAASLLVCTAVPRLKALCLCLFPCLSPIPWRSPKCNLERHCSFWSPAVSLSYIPIFSSESIVEPHSIAPYSLSQIRVAGVCRETCLHLFWLRPASLKALTAQGD